MKKVLIFIFFLIFNGRLLAQNQLAIQLASLSGNDDVNYSSLIWKKEIQHGFRLGLVYEKDIFRFKTPSENIYFLSGFGYSFQKGLVTSEPNLDPNIEGRVITGYDKYQLMDIRFGIGCDFNIKNSSLKTNISLNPYFITNHFDSYFELRSFNTKYFSSVGIKVDKIIESISVYYTKDMFSVNLNQIPVKIWSIGVQLNIKIWEEK